jgi:hypothetical protein
VVVDTSVVAVVFAVVVGAVAVVGSLVAVPALLVHPLRRMTSPASAISG